MALGIILQHAFNSLWCIYAILGFSVIAIIFKRKFLSIILLAASIGCINVNLRTPSELDNSLFQHPATYYGEILKARTGDASQQAIVEVKKVNGKECRRFKIQVISLPFQPELLWGYNIQFTSTLQSLTSEPDFPEDPDATPYLKLQNVQAKAIIGIDDRFLILPPQGWQAKIIKWRYELQSLIFRSSLSPGSKQMLATVLTGDRSYVSPDDQAMFSQAGLAHILSISGLHVGMIAWIISLMLYPLRVFMMWRTRIVATILLLWLFIFMVGAGVPVVRAGIMATLFLTARLIERQSSPLNSLGLAAIILLVISPVDLFTPGFQLTFIAVAAIFLITPKLVWISPKHRIKHYLLTLLAVPVAAMIGTGLFAAYYFHVFPLMFLVSNVVAALILPFLLLAGLLVAACTALGLPEGLFSWLGDGSYDAINGICSCVANIPHAVATDIWIEPWIMPLFMGGLILLIAALYRKRVQLAAMGCLVIIAACLLNAHSVKQLPSHGTYIVHEGDATGLLVHMGDKAWFYTTHPARQPLKDMEIMQHRSKSFCSRYGIKNLSFITDSLQLPGVSRCGNLISANNERYLFLYNDNQARNYETQVDNLIVCKGFVGNLIQAIDSIKPEHVFLAHDLNGKRFNKYSEELTKAGIPFYSLRKGFMEASGNSDRLESSLSQ